MLRRPAAPSRRENLAGIQEIFRIERLFEPLLQLDDRGTLLAGQERPLGEADAMFSGDRATEADRRVEHLDDRLFALVPLLERGEEQVHVQIAVPGVSVARGRQAVLLADPADRPDELDQL